MNSFHIAALSICALLWLCPPVEAQPERDIVLGMSAAFSGPSRGLGIEIYRGAAVYFQHINAQGGINGRKIVILPYDDGYNPDPAVNNTLRLIEKDEVLLLFQYVGTPTVSRILPLLKRYERENILLLFPLTGAQMLREPPHNRSVFTLRASYLQETEQIVENFLNQGRKRIGVFYQADAYGRSGWDGVRQGLAGHGLDIVGEASYRRGVEFEKSMTEQVRILQENAPDAVVIVGTSAAGSAFVRDSRNAGWNVPMAHLSFVNPEQQLHLLTEEGERRQRDYTGNLIFSSVIPGYEDNDLPAAREYRKLMDTLTIPFPEFFDLTDYLPQKYSSLSFEGFLNAKLLVEILRRVPGEIEREKIRTVIESLSGIDLGICCTVGFSPSEHQALNVIYFNSVVDGRIVPLNGWSTFAR